MRQVYIKYSILQLILYLAIDILLGWLFISSERFEIGIIVMLIVIGLEAASLVLIYYFVFRQILELEKAIFILNADNDRERKTWKSAKIDYLIEYIRKLLHGDQTNQILKTKAEISALQNQINPHFLYNTLETIRSRAMIKGLDDVTEMTEALGLLFRYSISNPGSLVTLGEEIDNVERYLLIQQYRFPGKIHFVKKIEDPSLLAYRLPKLTIQPLVENAIYHGIEMKPSEGTISVTVFATQSQLRVEISDDGLGMSKERLDELRRAMNDTQIIQMSGSRGTGIALININQRIKFYYGQEYGLQIRSAEDVGTVMTLILPAKGEMVIADEN